MKSVCNHECTRPLDAHAPTHTYVRRSSYVATHVLTGVGTRDTRWRRGSRRPKAGGKTTSRFDLSMPTGPIPLPHCVRPLCFACPSTCACLWLGEAPRSLAQQSLVGVFPPGFLPPSRTLSTLSAHACLPLPSLSIAPVHASGLLILPPALPCLLSSPKDTRVRTRTCTRERHSHTGTRD